MLGGRLVVEFGGSFQGVFGQGGVQAIAGDAAAGAAGSEGVFEHFYEGVFFDLVDFEQGVQGFG